MGRMPRSICRVEVVGGKESHHCFLRMRVSPRELAPGLYCETCSAVLWPSLRRTGTYPHNRWQGGGGGWEGSVGEHGTLKTSPSTCK